MAMLHQINVSLTEELEQFVRNGVETGKYATSSEVVREGLRLLQQRESAIPEDNATEEELAAIDEAKATQGTNLSLEELIRETER